MVLRKFLDRFLLVFVLFSCALSGLLASAPITAISSPLGCPQPQPLPPVEANTDVDCLNIFDLMLTVSRSNPADGATNVTVDGEISLSFSQPVNVMGRWFRLVCSETGSYFMNGIAVMGGPQNWALAPFGDFAHGEHCTMTILATQVTAQDGSLLQMNSDYSFSFTIESLTPLMGSGWVINEIHAEPDGTNGDANADGTVGTFDDEFVELVNNTGGDQDISGWALTDLIGIRHTFPANTTVTNGCAIVIFGGGMPTGVFGGAVVQTASSGSLGLNNGGDTLTLTDGSTQQASVTYGSEGGNEQSITLEPDVTGTEPYVRHTQATGSGGTFFSPGTKIDGSPFDGCTLPETAPSVSSTSPSDGAGGVALDADITINFSEEVTVSGSWYDITCTDSGNHTATVNGSSPTNTFTLNPDSDFTISESCTVTVIASLVSDADTDDPPDTMISNYSWTFTTMSRIVINEIMQNPSAVTDALGEWIELYNGGNSSVDLNDCILKDDGSDNHTIDNGGALNIAAGGYLVLGRNADSGTNGGVPVDYQYSSFLLNNTSDQVILVCDGSEVDRVNYDGGPNFPNPTGASMELSDPALDNNVGSNWAEATQAFGAGDLGSPGGVNDALAVTLADFSALPSGADILLRWETVLELDNLGFNLYRSTTSDQLPNTPLNPQFIPSQAAGSGQGASYEFTDSTASPATTYYYWLEDVDRNGSKALHAPISIITPQTTHVTIKTLTARLELPQKPLLLMLLMVSLAASVTLWQIRWRQ